MAWRGGEGLRREADGGLPARMHAPAPAGPGAGSLLDPEAAPGHPPPPAAASAAPYGEARATSSYAAARQGLSQQRAAGGAQRPRSAGGIASLGARPGSAQPGARRPPGLPAGFGFGGGGEGRAGGPAVDARGYPAGLDADEVVREGAGPLEGGPGAWGGAGGAGDYGGARADYGGGQPASAGVSYDYPSEEDDLDLGLDLHSLQAELAAAQNERARLLEQAKSVMDGAPAPANRREQFLAERPPPTRRPRKPEKDARPAKLSKEETIRRRVLREVFDALSHPEEIGEKPLDIQALVALSSEKNTAAVDDAVDETRTKGKAAKQKAVQKLEEAHRKEKVEMTRAHRAQFSEVNGENLRLKEEMDQMQAEKRRHTTRIKSFEAENQKLQDRAADLQSSLDVALGRVSSAEADMKATKRKAAREAEAGAEKHAAAVAQVEQRVAEKERRVGELEALCGSVREEMAHKLESAEQEKHRLLEGNESYWRGQVKAKEGELKQLETRHITEIESLALDNQAMHTVVDDLIKLVGGNGALTDAMIDGMREELEALRAYIPRCIDDFKTDVLIVTELCHKAVAGIEEGISRASLERDFKAVQGELREADKKIRELEKKYGSTSDEKSRFETSLAIENVKTKRLAETVANLRSTLRDAELQKTEMAEELAETKKAREEGAARLKDNEEAAAQTAIDLRRLENRLEEQGETLEGAQITKIELEKRVEGLRDKADEHKDAWKLASKEVHALCKKYFFRSDGGKMVEADPIGRLDALDINEIQEQAEAEGGSEDGHGLVRKSLRTLEGQLVRCLLQYAGYAVQNQENRESVRLTKQLVENTIKQKKAMAAKVKKMEGELKRLRNEQEQERREAIGVDHLYATPGSKDRPAAKRAPFARHNAPPRDYEILDALESVNELVFDGVPESPDPKQFFKSKRRPSAYENEDLRVRDAIPYETPPQHRGLGSLKAKGPRPSWLD